MHTFLIILATWLLGIPSFMLWDAFVGFGPEGKEVKWDGINNPPIIVASGLWGFTLPILLLWRFGVLLETARNNRIVRVEKKRKMRIATQKEIEAEVALLDSEFDQPMEMRSR